MSYNGAPEFTAIEGTSLQRAVNTDKDIIQFGGDLLLLQPGRVVHRASPPNGPWQVATTIPAEIYKIPASSPSHHVTYVVVEEDDNDNDEWVTFAYAAGYTGLMIGWGCAVWGSGWYYPPYVATAGSYYPHFGDYGYSAHYNPWTGAYGRSAVAYGPYGGMGASARYNPRTGTYSRGAVAWGPYGASGAGAGLQPAHRRLRADAAGLERLRQLGIDRRVSAVMTGRRPTASPIARPAPPRASTRTDEGAAISRNPRGAGGGFVAAGDERQRLRRPRRQRL